VYVHVVDLSFIFTFPDNKINLHKFSLPTETNKKEVTENEIVARNLPSKLDQLVAFSQDFFVICFEHKVNVYQELREGKVKRARFVKLDALFSQSLDDLS